MTNFCKTNVRLSKEKYATVMYAKKMIDEGTPIGLAIWLSAKYYKFKVRDVSIWFNMMFKKSKEENEEKYIGWAVTVCSDADPIDKLWKCGVDCVENIKSWKDEKYNYYLDLTAREDYGGWYAPCYRFISDRYYYETQKEAINGLKEFIKEKFNMQPNEYTYELDRYSLADFGIEEEEER